MELQPRAPAVRFSSADILAPHRNQVKTNTRSREYPKDDDDDVDLIDDIRLSCLPLNSQS
jgi:hypothetical protein